MSTITIDLDLTTNADREEKRFIKPFVMCIILVDTNALVFVIDLHKLCDVLTVSRSNYKLDLD